MSKMSTIATGTLGDTPTGTWRIDPEKLIDEYRLVIHPVAIGHGTGLFSALREPLQLDHLEARTFPSGTMIHTYRPHGVNR
jgi:dihydrofolate reductase